MRKWTAAFGLAGVVLLAGLALRCNDADETQSNAIAPPETVESPVEAIEEPAATAAPLEPRPPAEAAASAPESAIIPAETAYSPAPPTLPPQTWPLRIQVAEKDGRPVAGAEIIAVWRDGQTPLRASGRTNSSGLFSGEVLNVSRIESVSATAEGFAARTLRGVSLENGTAMIVLDRLPFLSGTALRPDGAPLDGPFTAIVFLASPASQKKPQNSLSLSADRMKAIAVQRFSRTSGKFLFERLAPGDYFVAIWSDAMLGGISERTGLGVDEASVPLKIVTHSSLSISGRASFRGSAGGESPAAGIEIRASNRGAALARSDFPPQTAATDSDGRYVLEGLPGGLYTVEAAGDAAGLEAAVHEDYPLRAPASEAVDFVLRRKSSRVAGAVYGEAGEPLAGAAILLLRGAPAPVQRKAVSDSAGHFEFSGLSQGIYRLGVAHPGETDRQKMLRIVLEDGGNALPVAIRFHPRKKVSGTVMERGMPGKVGFLKFLWREDLEKYPLDGGPILAPVDPKTGLYEILLEPGNYEVSAEGIAPQTLVIQADTVHDFEAK